MRRRKGNRHLRDHAEHTPGGETHGYDNCGEHAAQRDEGRWPCEGAEQRGHEHGDLNHSLPRAPCWASPSREDCLECRDAELRTGEGVGAEFERGELHVMQRFKECESKRIMEAAQDLR